MGLVLDTSAYSAGERQHVGVRQALLTEGQIFLPVTVIGELLYGFRKGSRFAENHTKLQKFTAMERVSIIPASVDIADAYSRIKLEQQISGYTIADNDLWIAAVCLTLQQPLLTLDTDFARIPQLELLPYLVSNSSNLAT